MSNTKTNPNDSVGNLTIRQHFAAMAMQGLLTRTPNRPNGGTDLGILESKRITEEAVIMADALIEQLNKQA